MADTLTLSTYQSTYQGLVGTKPADATIDNQSASVTPDGVVSVRFSSADIVQIGQLRDWLTSLLGA